MYLTQTQIAARFNRKVHTIRCRAFQADFPKPAKIGGPTNRTRYYRLRDVEAYWQRRGDGRGKWKRPTRISGARGRKRSV